MPAMEQKQISSDTYVKQNKNVDEKGSNQVRFILYFKALQLPVMSKKNTTLYFSSIAQIR